MLSIDVDVTFAMPDTLDPRVRWAFGPLGAISSIMGWRTKLLRHSIDEVRPVIEKRLAAGTVLLRAGEPCSGVVLIREGAVALLADVGGVQQRIGTRGNGAYVGDDAVLGDGISQYTVVALRHTTIEMLDRDAFLERIATKGGPWLPTSAAPPLHPRRGTGIASVVHLAAASPESEAALPNGGIEITTFPFVVGRAPTGPAKALDPQIGVLLDERPPFRLSKRQFTIVETDPGIGLSDAGSRLGTFVDGERLGIEPVFIEPGRTIEVVAGGTQSPFRFHLVASA